MLKDIKSDFFIKILFMHLNDYRQLKLIKYNKYIQNKLNIDLYNYKIFKGTYIEYETKGIMKEYNYFGNLEFEGEYLNGKRNGKGKKYYDNGELVYEGEYLNGKRNGKGKGYTDRGNLAFEGEYFNGKIWNGIQYDFYGNIINEFNNGKGKVKEYCYCSERELLFDGEYLNGERNGKGEEYYENGNSQFEGEYLNGKKWNGEGYDKYGNLVYELKNGNGFVKEYDKFEGYLKFEGEYLYGERNGKGKEYNSNGKI